MNANTNVHPSRGRRRKFTHRNSTALTLTPMLDMLTVVLIFLIVNFSPEKAALQGERAPEVQLPNSAIDLQELPKIQIEVKADSVKLNGKRLEGLSPKEASNETWLLLKSALDQINLESHEKTILLVADKDAPYELIDHTVAHLATFGYGDITLLTHKEEN